MEEVAPAKTTADNAPHHPHAVGNVHEIIVKELRGQKGRVLDAAAGDCELAFRLRGLGLDVTAVDVSFEGPGAPDFFRRCDLNRPLPFDSSSFDFVISVETLEHLESPWHFIREVSRVLKPGGSLLLSTPNISNVFSRLLFAASGKLLWFQECDLRPLGHITPIHAHILKHAAEDAGLRCTKTRYSNGRIPLTRIVLPTGGQWLGECVIHRFQKQFER